MQPLQEILSRIRFDAEFGRGTFALGYIDRVAGLERIVPFTWISLEPGHSSFSVQDDEGVTLHIPLHRVRTVYKNGVPIWQRH